MLILGLGFRNFTSWLDSLGPPFCGIPLTEADLLVHLHPMPRSDGSLGGRVMAGIEGRESAVFWSARNSTSRPTSAPVPGRSCGPVGTFVAAAQVLQEAWRNVLCDNIYNIRRLNDGICTMYVLDRLV